jgi:23S rRNA pseudouridine2605 synthase
MRLAKHLAHAGVASRRAAEELVFAGRIAVDGEVVTDPARDVTGAEAITVDGRPVGAPARERAVYLVNKPPGVVSTAKDPQGRPTVVSLVPVARRLYPVGRLDADSTGLILLTDDGELAHRLTHPSFEVPRVYRATVHRGPVREPALRRLREGVELEDGRTAPAQVRRIAHDVIEIVMHEGKKRQVRRMCEAVGHPVKALERIAFGPLRLGPLEPGKARRLKAAEVEALRKAGVSAPAGSRTPSARHPRDGGGPPRRGRRARTR